ncbi:capsid protein [Clostridium sporogenes]|uniref:major capsid protein n=1 Tax=Clostridium sporogenes TaxID=1509 RepID=UPI00077FE77E|nr:major capsid protein [Clostridium sporogenes]KYN77173.1 capsid protein [Clostridium sporogenes]
MSKILDIFNDKTVLTYSRERKAPSMLGQTLFPSQKIDDLDFSYIKGANSLPVVAKIHTFNSEAEIASRDGLTKVDGSLALIKRKIAVDEKDIIRLERPRTNREEQRAVDSIYNDIDNMMDSVYTRIEAMRMEAIQTGKVEIKENGVNATVDYGVQENHKITLAGENLWTDAAAKILEDVYNGTDRIVQDTGITPTRALTTKNIVNIMLKNTALRKAALGVNSDKLLTLNELNQLLESQDLPRIATYDDMYREQQADGKYKTKKYMMGDKFILLPEGDLGETLFAPTAEEIKSKEAKGDEHVFVQIYETNDPVASWTKAVSIAMPTFPMADACYMLTPIIK